MSEEPVGVFKFGGNKIQADQTGKFSVKLANGGEWFFDIDEIGKIDENTLGIRRGYCRETRKVSSQ